MHKPLLVVSAIAGLLLLSLVGFGFSSRVADTPVVQFGGDPLTVFNLAKSGPGLSGMFADDDDSAGVACTQPTASCPSTSTPVGTRTCSITTSADCTCSCYATGWICSKCARGCDTATNRCT